MPIPEMAGGFVETRLLEALVTATRAKQVLEIGTFTGVTALSLAEQLPAGGVVITLEVDEEHAAIARRHFDASPFATDPARGRKRPRDRADARRPLRRRLHRRVEARLSGVLRSGSAEACRTTA